MALSAGARFGAYEITSAIGAGGMGEVYRARDTRLKRDVALKILPPTVAGDRDRRFVIAPDGRKVVYRATDGGPPRLFIRTLDRLEPRELVESPLVRTPFFSPDTQWVAFFEGQALKKVAVSGGAPVTIGRTGGGGFGASWGDDGSIVFASVGPATMGIPTLMIIPASGGEPKALAPEAPGRAAAQTFPVVLPQSRGVLYRMEEPGRGAAAQGRLMLLDRKTGEHRELATRPIDLARSLSRWSAARRADPWRSREPSLPLLACCWLRARRPRRSRERMNRLSRAWLHSSSAPGTHTT